MTFSEIRNTTTEYVSRQDFLLPLGLSLLFWVCFFSFSYWLFALLAGILLVGINYYPLSSRMIENTLFLCLPVMTLSANYHEICLVYNATVFMLWTRSYAIHGTIKWRHVFLYFLMIASFAWHRDSVHTILGSGIMHGIAGPLNIWIYMRKRKWLRFFVYIIPMWMLLTNYFDELYFVAYWDLEIAAYYTGWFLGFNKETTVKRLFSLSLGIIVIAHIFWNVCANTVAPLP